MTLRICDGDLLAQDVEVIVNPWNRNIIPWWLLLPRGTPLPSGTANPPLKVVSTNNTLAGLVAKTGSPIAAQTGDSCALARRRAAPAGCVVAEDGWRAFCLTRTHGLREGRSRLA